MQRILIVEDSATMESLLASSLEELEQPTKSVEAENDFEGLRFLPREDFNLVVTDINMPDVNGHQGDWWPGPGGSGRERKRDWRAQAGSSSVMSGVDLLAEAGRALDEMTDALRETGTRIGGIVNSVRDQTKAASHVVALMEKVRESAGQIGAASAQQDQRNEIVYRSELTMREVAERVRRTKEDQASGFGRIRENVVGVRGAIEKITGSLREQSEACAEVEELLDGVAEGSHTNEAAARMLRESMLGVSEKAEELREDVERFRG